MGRNNNVQGAGLGLRRSMMGANDLQSSSADFFEIAPENWIRVGGRFGHQLRSISERLPLIAHGLTLSIGGSSALNSKHIYDIKYFLEQHNIGLYSEHLSYTDHGGQLYDLLPLPFTEEAISHTARRIRQVQDMLGRKIALENVSYYLTPGASNHQPLSETDFVSAVLEEADCNMLLDVNNVYVNSINHNYDARDFIQRMPAERIAYFHVAGHYVEDDGLIIDTHGSDVIEPVWDLLDFSYKTIGQRPTLLERDFNIPDDTSLNAELDIIKRLQVSQHYLNATVSNTEAA